MKEKSYCASFWSVVKSHANHEKHANRQSLPCHVAYKNIYLANPTFFMYTCKVDRCADEEYMYEKTVEIVSLLTPSDTPPFCYPIPFALIGPFPLSLLWNIPNSKLSYRSFCISCFYALILFSRTCHLSLRSPFGMFPSLFYQTILSDLSLPLSLCILTTLCSQTILFHSAFLFLFVSYPLSVHKPFSLTCPSSQSSVPFVFFPLYTLSYHSLSLISFSGPFPSPTFTLFAFTVPVCLSSPSLHSQFCRFQYYFQLRHYFPRSSKENAIIYFQDFHCNFWWLLYSTLPNNP